MTSIISNTPSGLPLLYEDVKSADTPNWLVDYDYASLDRFKVEFNLKCSYSSYVFTGIGTIYIGNTSGSNSIVYGSAWYNNAGNVGILTNSLYVPIGTIIYHNHSSTEAGTFIELEVIKDSHGSGGGIVRGSCITGTTGTTGQSYQSYFSGYLNDWTILQRVFIESQNSSYIYSADSTLKLYGK